MVVHVVGFASIYDRNFTSQAGPNQNVKPARIRTILVCLVPFLLMLPLKWQLHYTYPHMLDDTERT